MKLFKLFSLATCLLITLGGSYLAFENYQCKQYMQGVPNSNLQIKKGIAFLKDTDTPYTGKAYATVCGGECGFMSCSLLHWRGTYKEGKLHGEFDAPVSGIGDKHWFTPGDKTKTYIYENGARIK